MVLRETFVLVAIGITAGTLAALEASRLVASFLFGLKPNDPLNHRRRSTADGGRRRSGGLSTRAPRLPRGSYSGAAV
jgi:hypothetical protein